MSEEKEYEERLQRRLLILKDELEAGNIKFNSGLGIGDSLKKVRMLPDGTIDLNTVDASIRSLALATEHFHERKENKKLISLEEIQKIYFDHIENNFKFFHQQMKGANASIETIARFCSENDHFTKDIFSNFLEFLDNIYEFWGNIDLPAWCHAEDMDCLKAVYGGSFFPENDQNIASVLGVYTDTIILPDPFIRMRDYFRICSDSQKVYYIIKQALALLQYKELATAELDNPIVLVLPDYSKDEDDKEFINQLGINDVLIHAKYIFGKDFGSIDELIEFSTSLDDVHKLKNAIKDFSRLEFVSDTTVNPEEILQNYLKQDHIKESGITSLGLAIVASGQGRMAQANDLIYKSRKFNGIPIMDAAESWRFFNYKLEYDAYRADPENLKHLHISKGLQELNDGKMSWLGNVPPDALIEIRKDGALDEIRSILGEGINELISADPSNFTGSTDKIFYNIQGAFKDHQKKLDVLKRKKWKFAGLDIGSLIVMGSMEIAGAITGNPWLCVAPVVLDQFIDSPKIKELPAKYRQLAEEDAVNKRSPVGLLFECSK